MKQGRRQRVNRFIASVMTVIMVFTQFPIDGTSRTHAEAGTTITLQESVETSFGTDVEIPVSVSRNDGETTTSVSLDAITVYSDNESIMKCSKNTATGKIKIEPAGIGTANVHVGYGDKWEECEVTVTSAVSDLTIIAPEREIFGFTQNATIQFTAQYSGTMADNEFLQWSSEDDSVLSFLQSEGASVTAQMNSIGNTSVTVKRGVRGSETYGLGPSWDIKLVENASPQISVKSGAKRTYNGSDVLEDRDWFEVEWPAGVSENDVCQGITFKADSADAGQRTVTASFTCVPDSGFALEDVTVDGSFLIERKPISINSITITGSREYKENDLSIPSDAVHYGITGLVGQDTVSVNGITYLLEDDQVGNDKAIQQPSFAGLYLSGDKGSDYTCTVDPNVSITSHFNVTPLHIKITSSGITKQSDGTTGVVLNDDAQFIAVGSDDQPIEDLSVTVSSSANWNYNNEKPGTAKPITGAVSSDFVIGNASIYSVNEIDLKGDITFRKTDASIDLTTGNTVFTLETGVTVSFNGAKNMSGGALKWYSGTTYGGEDSAQFEIKGNACFVKVNGKEIAAENYTLPLTEGAGVNTDVYIKINYIYYGPVSLTYAYDETRPAASAMATNDEPDTIRVSAQPQDQLSGVYKLYIKKFHVDKKDTGLTEADFAGEVSQNSISYSKDEACAVGILVKDNAGNVNIQWVSTSDASAPAVEIVNSSYEAEANYTKDNNLKNLTVNCKVTDDDAKIQMIKYYLYDGKESPEKYDEHVECYLSDYSRDDEKFFEKTFTISYSGNNYPGYQLRIAVEVMDFSHNSACYMIYYNGTDITIDTAATHVYHDVDGFKNNVTADIPTFALDPTGGDPMIKITDGTENKAKEYKGVYYFDVKDKTVDNGNQGRKVSVSFNKMGYSKVYLYNNGANQIDGEIAGTYSKTEHCYIFADREWNFYEQTTGSNTYRIRFRIPDATNTADNSVPFGNSTFPVQNGNFIVDGTDPLVGIEFSPKPLGNKGDTGYYDGEVTVIISVIDPHLPDKDDMDVPYFKIEGENLPDLTWTETDDGLTGTMKFTGDVSIDSFKVEATDLTQRKKIEKSNDTRYVIDNTAPVFTIEYSKASNDVSAGKNEDGKELRKYYYGLENGVGNPKDVDVTITIKEQNLFYEEVSIKVIDTATGEPVAFEGPVWDPAQSIGNNIYCDTATAKLKIPAKAGGANDGEYRVEVSYTDPVGHEMTLPQGQNLNYWVVNGKYDGSEHVNVIDTIRPKAEFSITELKSDKYSFNSEEDPEDPADYYNFAFTGTFKVDDKNFINGKGFIHSEVIWDGVDKPLTPDENNDYVYEVLAEKANEGDYYFSISGNDLAMNKLEVTRGTGWTDNDKEGGSDKEFFISGKKVLDITAPEVELEILPFSGVKKTKKRTFGNTTRYYFSDGFNAKFNITEEHFSTAEEFVSVKYGENLQATNYAADKVIANNRIADPLLSMDDKYVYGRSFEEEGLYRFSIEGEDKAGNSFVVYKDPDGKEDEFEWKDTMPFTSYAVAIDKTHPALMDIVIGDFYKAKLEWVNGEPHYQVSLNHPYQKIDSTTVKFIRSDMSPAKIHYSIYSTTAPQNRVSDEYTYGYLDHGYVCNVAMNGQQVFYIDSIIMEDYAGNELVWDGNSNKIYLDVTPPSHDELAPTVQPSAIADGSGRGPAGNPLFASDVDVRITVEDPNEVVSSSGLYQLFYRVLVNGEDRTAESTPGTTAGTAGAGVINFNSSGPNYSENADTTDEELIYRTELNFHFDKNTYNYNDIKVYVWGGDDAGNDIAESSAAYYAFGIDSTNPTIDVSYDNNDVRNEKYFKADRVATVTVMERNFDPSRTVITTEAGARISGWEYRRGGSANGDDDKWISHVVYDHDGTYSFNVTATDLVGNEAPPANYGDSAAPRAFVIDKTIPVINVTFDNNNARNGKYYNKARTADVEITEHNFNAADVRVQNPASLDGSRIASPKLGAWNSKGDVQSADMIHSADGDYTLRIDYTDLAGNVAETYIADDFTIDTTAPELKITGVEDMHAYNDKVAPVIEYSDLNLDNESAKVEISGTIHKANGSLEGVKTEEANGGSLICSDIPHTKDNDDIYKAVGVIRDLAGNETTKEISFSVNRFGSNYIISDETQRLIDKVYTGQEQSIHVTEINVSELEMNEVNKAINGNIDKLAEGTDYQLTVSRPGWVQYDYEISAENFKEEGSYIVTLYSEDKATNKNSNRTIRDENGINELPIEFTVDKTAPSVIISGVEENGRYYDKERLIMLHFEDNNVTTRLEVMDDLGNVTVYYLEAYYDGSEDSRDIRKVAPAAEYVAITPNAEGDIELRIKSLNHKQSVQIKAIDAAGNVTELSSPRFLLTTNVFVQFINNTAAIVFTAIVLALTAAIVIVLIQRRKKKKNA